MSGAVREAVALLADGARPPAQALRACFEEMLGGGVEPPLTAAFLMGLRRLGETEAELVAGASVLRQYVRRVAAPAGAIDTCGTGGLGWASLNTSTATAFVVAGAGVPVAKHGNRSAPPKTGSADLLEALGVRLEADDEAIAECFRRARLAFLFAPAHHSAMRHVAPVRRALGIRTVFNMLGPLANPAGVRRQVLGVSSAAWLDVFAAALAALETERAWVVHGAGGLDEISLAGPTAVVEVTPGGVRRFDVTSVDFGLEPAAVDALASEGPAHNLAAVRGLLAGEPGPFRQVVLANAAAALTVAGAASTLREGAALAAAAIDEGRAAAAADALVAASRGQPA
jgi:anthranilate phosphoribosyltransferase